MADQKPESRTRKKEWVCRTCETARSFDPKEAPPTRHPCGGLGSFMHNWELKEKDS